MKTKTEHKPVPAPDRILRLPEVQENTGLSRSTIKERMAAKQFPRAIPLGGRLIGWSAREIADWVEERKAQRDQAA